MRSAFSRLVLWISLLFILVAPFTFAQTSSVSKNKLSKRALTGQPALAAAGRRAVSVAKSQAPPPAATDTWTGAGGTSNWSNASNWNSGAITTGENILINLTTAATVDDFNVSIGNLTLSNVGDTVTTTGATLTVNGTITNNGTINLAATVAGNQGVLYVGSNSTLSGTGTLVLGNGLTQNYITGASGAILTNSSTIEGGWTSTGYTGIGQGQIALANSGIINANVAGGTLNLDPIGSVGSTNTGTLEATNGSTLQMQGGTWTQTGAGKISAANGSTVSLQSGVSITGGTLATTGTGLFVLNNGGTVSLNNLTLAGTYDMQIPGTTDISGTITNNGSINMLANVAGEGQIMTTANATLAGTGVLLLGNETTQNVIGGSSGTTLTNASTIEGGANMGGGSYDSIGNGQITLANNGTINANVSGGLLYVNPIGSGASTNTKTMEATNGGILVLSGGTWTQTGAGTITAAAGSTVDLQNGVNITGGTLTTSGSGVIEQNAGGTVFLTNITNSGNYTIPTPGTTEISGTITNNGSINLLASDTNGGVGQLYLAANSTLTGTGVVLLGDENTQNFITGANGTTLTNNSVIEGGATIRGNAQIGIGQIILVNNGTINANASGAALFVDPLSSATSLSTNTATMEATNGGILVLNGGYWTQTGAGTISAAAGSIVQLLSGVSITGGTLSTTGSGVIEQADGSTVSLSNLTNAGTYNMLVPAVTEISGTITNNGSINMLANVAGEGQLNLAANTTLTGTGVLLLGNETTQNIIGGSGGTTLTNASTIEGGTNMGGGSFDGIGNGQISLANTGTINANVSGGLLYVNPVGSGANTNTGTLEATGGGILILDGSSWTQTGAGKISAAAGSTVQLTNGLSITGGTLSTSGSGVIEETNGQTVSLNSLTNSGTYNVLDSSTTNISGTITNNGTINLNSTGSPTSLFLTANTTLAGSGAVILNSGGNDIIDGVSGAILTNDSTIEGTGNLGNNHITITNNGTFDSNVTGGTLSILPGSGGFTNYNGGSTTLTGGTYIANGGNITFAAENTAGITTLSASVTEENGGQILNTSNSNANALANLTSITSTGALSIGGVAFTDAGAFSNAGSLTILAGETFKVGSLTQISGSSLTAGTFVLDGNLSLTGATQTITTNAANLTLAGGTIENANSTNALAALASNTKALTIGGSSNNVSTTAASFSNTGTLTINASDSFTATTLTQLAGANTSKTLSAGIYVLAGNLDLTTSGLTISKNAATLTLEGGTINSNGVNALRALATNTGKLTIGGTANNISTSAASFSNTGTLTINTGDTFTAPALTQISGSTLSGGTFVLGGNLDLTATANITTNSSVLTLEGGTIKTGSTNDLANLSSNTDSLTLANNASFTAAGNFTNSGALTINKGSTFTLTGTHTLTNLSAGTLASGTYTVGGTLQLTTTNGGIATNAANLTLTGTSASIKDGTSNALSGFTTNTGTFALASSATFTTGGNFTDSGTVTIAKSTKLTIGGTNKTYTQSAGTTNLDGTLAGGSATVTGGLFQGAGTVSKSLTIGGGGTAPTLNVGDAGKAGLLSITGTYTQLSTGTMTGLINGTAAGSGFSQLKVTGAASLAGTINFTVAAGFQGSLFSGETFTALTASSVTGTFSNSTIAINSSFHFTVTYTSTGVVLTVASGAEPNTGSPQQPVAQTQITEAKAQPGRVSAVVGNSKPILIAKAKAKTMMAPSSGRSNAILARGTELTNLRSWEGLPVVSTIPVRPVAVAAIPSVTSTNLARIELPKAEPWVGQNHTIGVQSPLAGWMGASTNRRIPVKIMAPILPRAVR